MRLSNTEKIFTVIFLIIVTLELFSERILNALPVYVSPKPFILLSLIVFFFKQSKHLGLKIRIYTLLALLFSFNGDVLLMLVNTSPSYFMFGLVAFLLAHLMYIRVFLSKRHEKNSLLPIVALLLMYAICLFYFIKNGLGNLLIPVVLYILVILTMVVTAWSRKGLVPKLSFTLVFIGALLFMVSDSVLALNKFYSNVPYEHLLIMSTYAFAQYCIVMGIIKQEH